MPYTKVLKPLSENIQLAYRQAIDADNKLNLLKKEGHGKFSNIFKQSQVFTTQSNRFLPYVEEIANDLQIFTNTMQNSNTDSEQQLQLIVTKLGLLLQLLKSFKTQS